MVLGVGLGTVLASHAAEADIQHDSLVPPSLVHVAPDNRIGWRAPSCRFRLALHQVLRDISMWPAPDLGMAVCPFKHVDASCWRAEGCVIEVIA